MTEIAPSLQAHLVRRLDAAPDDRALTFVGADGTFAWQSYAEVWRKGLARAAVLSEAGLGEGEVAILALGTDELAVTTLLGVLQLGAIPLLVAPPVVRGLHSNLEDVLRHVVRKTRAKVVVAGEETEAVARRLGATSRRARYLVGPAEVDGGDPDLVTPVIPTGDAIAAYQLTSGTTGFPRVCVWQQSRVIAALDGMAGAMDLSPEDVCLNWTPLYHDMGLVNNFFTCFVKRLPLALLDTMEFVKRPARWIRALHDTGATVTWSPNFGFAVAAARVRDRQLEGVRLDHVKGLWNAAEKIHWETIVAFRRKFEPYGLRPDAVRTNFGCAENVGGATFSDPHGQIVVEHVDGRALYGEGVARPVPPEREGEAGVVPIVSAGRAYPGMELSVLSPRGRRLPDGEVGELALDTPSRLLGYLSNAAETRRALRYDLLRTGDLAYLRDGECFWVGRVRERINLHGKKYDPSDFEAVQLAVDGLRLGCFAVFGVDDPAAGTQRIVLVSEVRSDPDRSHDEIMQELLERTVREVGVTLDDVVLVPAGSMTKTSSGKRRHRAYRQFYVEGSLEPVARLRPA